MSTNLENWLNTFYVPNGRVMQQKKVGLWNQTTFSTVTWFFLFVVSDKELHYTTVNLGFHIYKMGINYTCCSEKLPEQQVKQKGHKMTFNAMSRTFSKKHS